MPLFKGTQTDQSVSETRRTTTLALSVSPTFTNVTLDTIDLENDTVTLARDGTNTERITLKTAGVYLISYAVECPVLVSTTMQILKNGTTVVPGSSRTSVPTAATDKQSIAQSFVASFSANDYIALQGAINAGSGSLAAGTTLTVVKLSGTKGPPGSGAGHIVSHQRVVPTTSAPTTTSTVDPMTAIIPEMTYTFTPQSATNLIRIAFSGSFSVSSNNVNSFIEVYIDGTKQANTLRTSTGGQTTRNMMTGIEFWTTLSVASHTITIRWRTGSGTLTALALDRLMSVTEFAF